MITDEIRQAVLLAEGVAHSLIGEEENRVVAIDCFRQVEDFPGSPETLLLRQQATYNEAVIWARSKSAGRCVLMLTELLGERAPDTLEVEVASAADSGQGCSVPAAIQLAARVARLAAFATYSRDDWSSLPASRAQFLIDDAEKLVKELGCRREEHGVPPHHHRLLSYMYIESLRAIGHIELTRAITGAAADLYQDKRPTGLRSSTISKPAQHQIRHAIQWMLRCEQLAPNCVLFCDLAEGYLLLKEFGPAQGYARHATLDADSCPERADPCYERAFYIAAESFSLEGNDRSRGLAKKYAQDFKGTVTLDEFKAVRSELGIRDETAAASGDKAPLMSQSQ